MKLFEKYASIQQEIWSTQILVVTKYQSDEIVLELVQSWISLIGESKVQDAQRKYKLLTDAWLDFSIQLIGHLQTNKVSRAIEIFDVIQSVDSEKLLRKIDSEVNSEWQRQKKVQEVYLQLNLAWEEHKYGFLVKQLWEMISLCHLLPGISCTGLMCMGSLWDTEKTRSIYRTCRALCNEYTLPNCSMWMSWDRIIAVEEWSTMLRLGSILFEETI